MKLLNVFIERYYDWIVALFQHIRISLLSLVIAIIIAVPLGIVLSNYKKIKEWTLHITGIFQTIPSLALLGLFIPFMGIGTLPAVVTLVIYGIFPIFQGTLTGLEEIDPLLEEVAEAFGMTKWEKLKKFQICLAMPILMSGVRVASVMIIGTATLAALIGAGGLGTFILLGIDRNNIELILIGAISSAVLALILGYLIKKLQNKKPKIILLVLVLLSSLLGVSFIPFGYVPKDKIVIAGKLGSEQEIIINMYKILIEENTKLKVEVKENFGKTIFLYNALKSKDIDIYPEYTGTVISTLLDKKINNLSNNPKDVYRVSKKLLMEQNDLVYLEPSLFQNTYSIALKKEKSKEYGIKKIQDLKKWEDIIVAGFSLEFNDRKDGNIGLRNIYNLHLNVKTMEPSIKYEAIKNDEVDIIEVYSTDSQIITNNLTILEDDRNLFPPYQVAPLLRRETLIKYPELEEILNKLSNKITNEEMIEMNYKVDIEGKKSYEVALEYLINKKIIKNFMDK